MPNVEPQILRWARETSGLELQDAAVKLGIKDARGISGPDRLAALENGLKEPTRTMLVKMAKHYRRPLVTFYLSEIPRKGDRGEDFRTLPEPASGIQSGLIDAVVRDIYVRQDLLRSCLEVAGMAKPLSFISSFEIQNNKATVASVVNSIKTTLNFSLEKFREQNQISNAFRYFRSLTEANGIFVLLVDNLGNYHSKISVESFRGFALADKVAPFIVINSNDHSAAWSFTLAHELAHLWIGATGLSAGSTEKQVEQFCNDVASDLLLPIQDLEMLNCTDSFPLQLAVQQISQFAKHRNVSSTMVAYKLHKARKISYSRYKQLEDFYFQSLNGDENMGENSKKKSGPNYYTVRKHRRVYDKICRHLGIHNYIFS